MLIAGHFPYSDLPTDQLEPGLLLRNFNYWVAVKELNLSYDVEEPHELLYVPMW